MAETVELETDFVQKLISKLNDPVIMNLKDATDLSRSLLESTHQCFIGFNSGTSIQSIELEIFGNEPHTQNKYFAIYFCTFELRCGASNWDSEYSKSFRNHRGIFNGELTL